MQDQGAGQFCFRWEIPSWRGREKKEVKEHATSSVSTYPNPVGSGHPPVVSFNPNDLVGPISKYSHVGG